MAKGYWLQDDAGHMGHYYLSGRMVSVCNRGLLLQNPMSTVPTTKCKLCVAHGVAVERGAMNTPINLLTLDPDRNGAFTVWLTEDGKWHASGHWYAFMRKEDVLGDAIRMANRPDTVAAFAIRETSRYRAIRKAKAMLASRSLQ